MLFGANSGKVSPFMMVVTLLVSVFVIAFIGNAWSAWDQKMARAPGVALAKKFVGLGKLRGRSFKEIVDVCGPPNAIDALSNGRSLRQWVQGRYQIALTFEGDTCQGVASEMNC